MRSSPAEFPNVVLPFARVSVAPLCTVTSSWVVSVPPFTAMSPPLMVIVPETVSEPPAMIDGEAAAGC